MSEEKKTDIDQSEESQENLESSAGEAVDVEIVKSEEEEAAEKKAKQESTEATEEPSEQPKSTEPVNLAAEEHRALVEQSEKASENWDRFLRLNAEFDNYKKRAARDRLEAIKYANESVLESLIPTLDNFEMAMMAVDTATVETIDSLKQGISMVHKQLRDVIKDSGMEEIDAANQAFDPAWHEAVSQQESEEVPEGQVLQQLRKGYKLKERLIRPATVIVAKAKAASEESKNDAS
jgi:molecular chaperone GrpE